MAYDKPVIGYAVPPPAPPTPSESVNPEALTGVFAPTDPFRRRGGWQDGGALNAPTPPQPGMQQRMAGGPQSGETEWFDPMAEALRQARIQFLYEQDTGPAMTLQSQVSPELFDEYFSQAAIEAEIARIIQHQQNQGTGTFLEELQFDLAPYVPIATMAALGFMGGALGTSLAAPTSTAGAGVAAEGAAAAADLSAAGSTLGMSNTALGGAAGRGMFSLAAGASPEGALLASFGPMGVEAGANFIAPYASDVVDSFSGMDFGPTPTMFNSGGMMPAAVPEVDPTFGGMLTELSPGMFASAGPVVSGMTTMPPAVPEGDPTFGGDLYESAPRVFEPAAAPPQSSTPSVTGADIQRYTNLARTLANLTGQETPAGAPQQDEGESAEQYSQELAQYLALDPQSMADAGLEPGSPEYLEYIMAQADSVIEQVLGNEADASPEQLAAALRSKTAEEVQALQRALYARGQADLLMRSGTFADPVSGTAEEVIGSGMFNPNVAAFQRGRARDVEGLAGAEDPRGFLDQILGRETDLFGMQAGADARFAQAKQNETQQMEDELRRRRGMLGY